MIKKKILVLATVCSMALFTAFSPVSPMSQITTLTAEAAHTHKWVEQLNDYVVHNADGWTYVYTVYKCKVAGCIDTAYELQYRYKDIY